MPSGRFLNPWATLPLDSLPVRRGLAGPISFSIRPVFFIIISFHLHLSVVQSESTRPQCFNVITASRLSIWPSWNSTFLVDNLRSVRRPDCFFWLTENERPNEICPKRGSTTARLFIAVRHHFAGWHFFLTSNYFYIYTRLFCYTSTDIESWQQCHGDRVTAQCRL